MRELTLEELKQRLRAQFDETMLLDALGLDINDLVELLEDQIAEHYEELSAQLED